MRAQGADAARGSWQFLGRLLREVAGGSDRRARGAVRERATRAAGSRARSDAGGWVWRFGRATRVAGEQRRQVGQVCQRRGEGRASADGVCCGTGRCSRVSRPCAEKWAAGREGAGLPCPAGWAGGKKGWAGLGWIKRARLDRVLGWSLGCCWAGFPSYFYSISKQNKSI